MSTIRTLFEIIIFKAKPSDTPFSVNATTLAFTLAWLISYIGASLQSNMQPGSLPTIPNPLIFTLIQIATYGAMIALFLSINKKQNRIHQTLLASYGALVITDTIALFSFFIGLPALLVLVKIWGLIAQIYILKHSHDSSSGQAFFMIIAIYMIALLLIALAFPEYFKEHIDAMQKLQLQTQ